MRWEYRVVLQRSWIAPEKLGANLNRSGAEAWELVSVVYNPEMGYTLFYFKRPSIGDAEQPAAPINEHDAVMG